MTNVGLILLFLIRVYLYLVIGRVLVEMIFSFSRNPQPPRWFIRLAEPILFMTTDPPLNLLRRIIPPVRMGNIALDVAVLVLFFLLMILQMLVGGLLIK
ncbi:YggT family protein [Corynebacterium sp. 3HC-13]|uniref:YggT family protein n=1 Tax=Corynebacterium poyangense TaxID=2684405 RepID=UPI001CCF3215|nr:YggT family protein [Corynebacterium poyangense]MBZ8178140.1 YggT family protein [Corynebacterium poyangense]